MSNKTKLPFELDDLTLSSGSDHIIGGYADGFTATSGTYDSMLTMSSLHNIDIINDTITINPLTIGPIGTPNSVYTISGTGSTGWNTSPMAVDATGSIALQGDGADITINGVKLSETLKALQERLNVLVPNPKLEKDWEDLAELGRQYRKLEKHITEKMATWDKLKSMPKIDVN